MKAGSVQVEQAAQSVGDIQRMNGLIAELAAAAAEQRDGINQMNAAMTNSDQLTQKNAALVEEFSAAACAMRDQAQCLAQAVAVFKVGGAS